MPGLGRSICPFCRGRGVSFKGWCKKTTLCRHSAAPGMKWNAAGGRYDFECLARISGYRLGPRPVPLLGGEACTGDGRLWEFCIACSGTGYWM